MTIKKIFESLLSVFPMYKKSLDMERTLNLSLNELKEIENKIIEISLNDKEEFLRISNEINKLNNNLFKTCKN